MEKHKAEISQNHHSGRPGYHKQHTASKCLQCSNHCLLWRILHPVQGAHGETYDLTFYAWAAPGSIYPFHCHILAHLMNPGQGADEMGGLITLIEYAK